MAKSLTFDNQFLALIFNGTAMSVNLAINATSAPLTFLWLSLHTADPTSSGTQSTNEISYTSYARASVARTTAGWTVSSSTVSPLANISFALSGGGTGGTVTNWAVGTAASGTGQILWTGTVSPNIAVTNGVTPILTTASTVTET
jgi:hypothetical protein